MMAMANEKVTDFVVSNGTRLYYEKQGAGQSLLFIAGSTGDAGNFTRAAALLADDFTVVTYDRRGNSRSERAKGWTTTSVAEQADDAAGIIQALGLAPAVVFGASAGGAIALDLMTRHSRLVRAGILQDPAIFAVLPDPATALAPRRALIDNALKKIRSKRLAVVTSWSSIERLRFAQVILGTLRELSQTSRPRRSLRRGCPLRIAARSRRRCSDGLRSRQHV